MAYRYLTAYTTDKKYTKVIGVLGLNRRPPTEGSDTMDLVRRLLESWLDSKIPDVILDILVYHIRRKYITRLAGNFRWNLIRILLNFENKIPNF